MQGRRRRRESATRSVMLILIVVAHACTEGNDLRQTQMRNHTCQQHTKRQPHSPGSIPLSSFSAEAR